MKTVTRSPKIASSVQMGTAMAHIVHTCTQIGTRNAAAVAVATVPPKPGMTRTAMRNAGEPTGKRFTQAGSRARYSCTSSKCVARRLIQYPSIAAKTSPIALMIEPSTGPKIAPFIMANASVTENGAAATSAKTTTAKGNAMNPMVRMRCST